MTMQDPISDMLTRIRNALSVKKQSVIMPYSKVKGAISDVLKAEGYITNWASRTEEDGKPIMEVELKYYKNQPVIASLERVSKPSLRIYKASEDLDKVNNGLGIAIVSTSKGVMTDKQARRLNEGGEVMCYVN